MATKKVSFEASMQQIDEIIYSLQNGNKSLSEALKEYETAINCINNCNKILNESMNKIDEIGGAKN